MANPISESFAAWWSTVVNLISCPARGVPAQKILHVYRSVQIHDFAAGKAFFPVAAMIRCLKLHSRVRHNREGLRLPTRKEHIEWMLCDLKKLPGDGESSSRLILPL